MFNSLVIAQLPDNLKCFTDYYPNGIAVEVEGNHLYLPDSGKGVIQRIHFKSQTAKTIIGQNVQ